MSESSLVKSKTPLLADSTYSKLKHTATIILPALAALYIALSQVWHFPKVEEVAGSIAALNTFIGLLLKVSTKSYETEKYSGDLVVAEGEDGQKDFVLALNSAAHADALTDKNEATFKVITQK